MGLEGSILNRWNLVQGPSLSVLQTQVDSLVTGFVHHATEWKSLASLSAGALAYRAGKLGILAAGGGNAARVLSIGAGLTAEVSAFELTNRALMTTLTPTLSHQGRGSPIGFPSPLAGEGWGEGGLARNLWRWSGNGGLRQGLLQSLFTFGALKSAGHFTRGQNLILQHLAQDTALVAGHQISGAFHVTPLPKGSLAEQFLHAEATTLQIGAGVALAQRFTPGLHALERGLDLSLRMTSIGARETPPLQGILQPAFAGASASHGKIREPKQDPKGPQILQMNRLEGENIVEEREYFEDLSERAETDPEVLDYLKILAEAEHTTATLALAAAAERNPRAVFVLRDLFLEGHDLAVLLLRGLDVSELVRQAEKDPEAVWALRALEEVDNLDAIDAMGTIDFSSKNYPIPMEPLFFSPARRPFYPLGRLREIGEKAEADPRSIFFLKKLSNQGDLRATNILLTLTGGTLARRAATDLEAAYALYELAEEGNNSALQLIKIIDVNLLVQDLSPKSLGVLAFAARAGNEDAILLWDLALKKRRGTPAD